MKHGSTLFLKIVLLFLAMVVVIAAIVWLPCMDARSVGNNPNPGLIDYGILVYVYTGIIPYLFAIYQAFNLLRYIDKDEPFTERSVAALRNIKYCALSIIGLLLAGAASLMIFGVDDDAAGPVALMVYISFVSTVIATFAALLQKLIQNGIDIKSENDLTV